MYLFYLHKNKTNVSKLPFTIKKISKDFEQTFANISICHVQVKFEGFLMAWYRSFTENC